MIKIPETKSQISKRAKKLKYPTSSIVRATGGKANGKYFLAPRGLKKRASKQAYANMRSSGMSKSKAAKISWTLEK